MTHILDLVLSRSSLTWREPHHLSSGTSHQRLERALNGLLGLPFARKKVFAYPNHEGCLFAELPDEGAMQRGGQQHMNAQPAGATPQINSNFAPSPHAQSYGSPRRSPHHSQHPSPRAHVQDPFAAATAAAPAQAHSGAHSAGSFILYLYLFLHILLASQSCRPHPL